MPLVRIDLREGKPESYRSALGKAVYDAMIGTINVPADDRFMVITEHPASGLVIAPSYLGIEHSPDCVLIQVTLNAGRTVEMKKAFYRAIVDGAHALTGIRKEDVIVNLVEVPKENWSFGLGEATYA
ncbi:MAG TPA: tautomerase family protein [Luteibacter sp.]|nr:tautomerase family protein [Luteibacter sp.]